MRYYSLLILSILFCSGLATAQGWAVTPGDGVGAISVGMSTKAADLVLNPTRRLDGKGGLPDIVEYGSEMVIEFDNAGRATIISLLSNTIQTKNGSVKWNPYHGAAIGTPWTQVVGRISSRKMSHKLPTAKGHPNEDYHAYPRLGIGFRVKGGAISRVDIWQSK